MIQGELYTRQQVIDAIRDSEGLITHAAQVLGCSYNTVRRYVDLYSDVKDALRECRESTNDVVESALLKRVRAGDTAAIIFYAKTQMRDRGYVERLVIEHGVSLDIVNAAIKALVDAGLNPVDVFGDLVAQVTRVQPALTAGEVVDAEYTEETTHGV